MFDLTLRLQSCCRLYAVSTFLPLAIHPCFFSCSFFNLRVPSVMLGTIQLVAGLINPPPPLLVHWWLDFSGNWSNYFICRARRSSGKMSTAVTALLNEIEEYREEGLDMPQEEAEFYQDDSVHGQLINPTLLSLPLILKQKHGVIERIYCLDYFQFFL